ncbi:MAG: hypothetical protein ACR2QF_02550 [Geminicoccaceae bacterium]
MTKSKLCIWILVDFTLLLVGYIWSDVRIYWRLDVQDVIVVLAIVAGIRHAIMRFVEHEERLDEKRQWWVKTKRLLTDQLHRNRKERRSILSDRYGGYRLASHQSAFRANSE